MDDATTMLTIGQLAQRTGLPVRTIRYWSDIGAVPPAGRTARDHRRYDAAAVARLELVATLRELGLGLAEVRRVLDRGATVAEVAATHVEALDAQIRTLRLRRAVLATVARRKPGTEEMTLMNKLATLSAQERKQIIDDFVDEVFAGLEPDAGLAAGLRQVTPELPDDPSAEQVDAWVELAELVQDPAFRRRVRIMAEHGDQAWAGESTQVEATGLDQRVMEHAGAARQDGVDPGSAEGAAILDRILAGTQAGHQRAELLEALEVFTDARVERYWQLMGIMNGWTPFTPHVPAFEWMIAALRAHL
jgi:DNA-binding transcriptional MerR regulator